MPGRLNGLSRSRLPQVCANIIIPNLRVRDEDEDVFEFNYVEYIRRDTEGSDSDTRRRAACELVKSLTEKFPAEVQSKRIEILVACPPPCSFLLRSRPLVYRPVALHSAPSLNPRCRSLR